MVAGMTHGPEYVFKLPPPPHWFINFLLRFKPMHRTVIEILWSAYVTEYKILFGKKYILNTFIAPPKQWNCRCFTEESK